MREFEVKIIARDTDKGRSGGLCRIGEAVSELLAVYRLEATPDTEILAMPSWAGAEGDLALCAAAT